MKTLSNSDIEAISNALYYTQVREGSYASSNPYSDLMSKIVSSKETFSIDKMTGTELGVLLKSINENISFLTVYDYGPVDKQYAELRRHELLEPLRSIKSMIE